MSANSDKVFQIEEELLCLQDLDVNNVNQLTGFYMMVKTSIITHFMAM